MVNHPKYKIIAILAGIITLLGFSYLVLRVHNSKQTEHLPFIWIFYILIAQTLLALYGFLNNACEIYVPALIVITGITYILYIKLNFETSKNIEADLEQKNIL